MILTWTDSNAWVCGPTDCLSRAAKARGGKVIQGSLVDTNSGDSAVSEYRNRFVAKSFSTGMDPTLSAATPPLKALKLLMSYAAGDNNVRIRGSDFERAYFDVLAARELHVELPKEDPGYQEGCVGKFRLALYGTRDAAQLWQECLAEQLESTGFARGRFNAMRVCPQRLWHYSFGARR